jgi:hypothetical protein
VNDLDKKAFTKYLCALLLFGLNGIVASKIALSSYEIVFLRTFIGSILLVSIFKISKGKFRIKENKKDALFITFKPFPIKKESSCETVTFSSQEADWQAPPPQSPLHAEAMTSC